MRVGDLIERVTASHPDGDALRHLSDALAVSELLDDLSDRLLGHFVQAVRDAGAAWAEIGRSMGVTRQAAQKRFAARPGDVAALAGVDDR
ncbi:hypothetical protein [Actinomadura keratinilytica]|uniref:Uncharacterized protein n=1 Tax=Actinomadura keratinilytica TaxID=547461 RepID=A0ABP7Z5X7_9ACTN